MAEAERKHADSLQCTAHLTEQIVKNEPDADVMDSVAHDREQKAVVHQRNRASATTRANEVQSRLPPLQQRAMSLAREKGGSSTLTSIPVSEHGLCFDAKADFHDHVHLRYGWPLDRLPDTCPCGERFTVDHAQICKLSGFIHMRHDEVTNFLASCMKEIHNDVEVEPTLQPITGEAFRYRTANVEPDARADIRVRGFWNHSRNAFFDTRVFYPHAASYRSQPIASIYRKLEGAKKREYGERVNQVEHGSFTPLVFSSCGGMGPEADIVVKRIADALASKRKESYSKVVCWMRCCLAFSLARSAIRCVRGSRSVRRRHINLVPVDLVQAEAHLGTH